MVYDPGAQTGSLGVSLVTGVMSFVSGEIAKVDPDAMVLKTPLATIGIRGTAGSIDNTQTLTVVLTREGDGTVGEITVTTQGGVQVLNSPFQGTQVTDANAPPTQTFTMTPEQFQQQFGQSVQAMNDTLTETGQQTLPPPTADDGNQQDGEAGDIAPESADDQGPGDGPPAEFRPEQFQEFFDAQLEIPDRERDRLDRLLDEFLRDPFREAELGRDFFGPEFDFLPPLLNEIQQLALEDVNPIIAEILDIASSASSIAAAAETDAATKKAAIDASLVAQATASSVGLTENEAIALSQVVTAPLEALGVASAVAQTAQSLMTVGLALFQMDASGQDPDEELLLTLLQAANDSLSAATNVKDVVDAAISAVSNIVTSSLAAAAAAPAGSKASAAEANAASNYATQISNALVAKGKDANLHNSLDTLVDSVKTQINSGVSQAAVKNVTEEFKSALDFAAQVADAADNSAASAKNTVNASTAADIRSHAQQALSFASSAKTLREQLDTALPAEQFSAYDIPDLT